MVNRAIGHSVETIAPCLCLMGACMRELDGDQRPVFPMRANTAICSVAPDAGNRQCMEGA